MVLGSSSSCRKNKIIFSRQAGEFGMLKIKLLCLMMHSKKIRDRFDKTGDNVEKVTGLGRKC